jgi:hypothetical protein
MQNHGLTVFAKYLFCREHNVGQNEADVEALCSVCWGQQNGCVLIIWSYGRHRLVFLQCVLVSVQFWCPHSSGVRTVLVPAQFWCPYSSDKSSWFPVWRRIRGSERLYQVPNGVEIRTRAHVSVVWIFVALLSRSLLKNGCTSKARWESRPLIRAYWCCS